MADYLNSSRSRAELEAEVELEPGLIVHEVVREAIKLLLNELPERGYPFFREAVARLGSWSAVARWLDTPKANGLRPAERILQGYAELPSAS